MDRGRERGRGREVEGRFARRRSIWSVVKGRTSSLARAEAALSIADDDDDGDDDETSRIALRVDMAVHTFSSFRVWGLQCGQGVISTALG